MSEVQNTITDLIVQRLDTYMEMIKSLQNQINLTNERIEIIKTRLGKLEELRNEIHQQTGATSRKSDTTVEHDASLHLGASAS